VRPLSECPSVNGEHILPSAFGAPESFTVPADASENQRINIELDAPTINMSLLRMIAMAQGVKTRSGDIDLKTVGVIQETGEEVNSTFSANGFKTSFRKPVEESAHTGYVRVVKGMGEDAMRMAQAIKTKYEKKGLQVEIGDPVSIAKPTINHRLELDVNLLRRMMVKIAYLMTVRLFGDEAIQSDNGRIYRSAMMAKDDEAMSKTGIGGGTYEEQQPSFLPKSLETGHTLSCFRFGAQVVSSVTLFGIFRAFFVTPANKISATDGYGEVIRIDAATSTLSSKPYLDSMVELLEPHKPTDFRILP